MRRDTLRRLRAALCRAALLTESEVGCAIRCYRDGLRHSCCEAVTYYGGPLRAIQNAFRLRHELKPLPTPPS
jgi:hypothetical protein